VQRALDRDSGVLKTGDMDDAGDAVVADRLSDPVRVEDAASTNGTPSETKL